MHARLTESETDDVVYKLKCFKTMSSTMSYDSRVKTIVKLMNFDEDNDNFYGGSKGLTVMIVSLRDGGDIFKFPLNKRVVSVFDAKK